MLRRSPLLGAIMIAAALSRASPAPVPPRLLLACWALSATHRDDRDSRGGCFASFRRLFRCEGRDSASASATRMAAKGPGIDPMANINAMQTIDAKDYTPLGPARWKPSFDFEEHVRAAWLHWDVLGNPQYVCAPMVDQSELSFRMLTRKYGVELAYTPMLHSKMFADNDRYRKDYLTTCEGDRPLVVQFCANNPATLLTAAQYVTDRCDAVDLNFGCPQDIARRGKYGAFLMDDPDRVHDLILTLKQTLSVPVWVKMRVFDDLKKTVAFARMAEAAGASVVAVHGRTKEQRGNVPGPAKWDYIRAVKEALRVPVIANGNVQSKEEADNCLRETRCDAVMSATGLLTYPSLFSGKVVDPIKMCEEYLEFAELYKCHPRMVRPHVFCMLLPMMKHRPDLLAKLGTVRIDYREGSCEPFREFLQVIRAEIGSLEEAQEQQRKLAESYSDDVVDEETEEVLKKEINEMPRNTDKAKYKSILRKQRTLTKQMRAQEATLRKRDVFDTPIADLGDGLGVAGLFEGGDDEASPRRVGDKHGIKVQTADVFRDERVELVKGFGEKSFIVRKSNSSPSDCVSVTYLDRLPEEPYHMKVRREKGPDGEQWQWRALWDDGSAGEFEVVRDTLDELLEATLVASGFLGIRDQSCCL